MKCERLNWLFYIFSIPFGNAIFNFRVPFGSQKSFSIGKTRKLTQLRLSLRSHPAVLDKVGERKLAPQRSLQRSLHSHSIKKLKKMMQAPEAKKKSSFTKDKAWTNFIQQFPNADVSKFVSQFYVDEKK